MIETLESRRMLSSSITASLTSGGALTVTTGSDGSFANVVEANGTVLVNNVTAGTSQTFTGVTSIRINGQAKQDTLYYTGNSIGAKIDANGGNDIISIADIGTGSSYATGNGGDDSLTIIFGHRTTVVGGGGNDQIFLNTDTTGLYGNVTQAETFSYGDGGGDTFLAYEGINHIYGGGGSDIVIDMGGTNIVDSADVVTF